MSHSIESAAIDSGGAQRLTRMLAHTGHFLFRYRNAMFPLACLPLLIPGAQPLEDSFLAALLGAAIALMGQAVRALTIGLRYVIRGGRGRRVYAEDLVTDGIYSHLRNPMYLGNLLIVVGVATAANSWPTLLLGVPLALFMYSCIIAAEEQYLLGRFGAAFEAYCADVPRWIPRLSGLADTLRSSRFHWRRLLVKEYGTPFGWINIVAAVTLLNFWVDGEWRARGAEISTLTWAVAITAVFWFVAWRLKKSRTILPD